MSEHDLVLYETHISWFVGCFNVTLEQHSGLLRHFFFRHFNGLHKYKLVNCSNRRKIMKLLINFWIPSDFCFDFICVWKGTEFPIKICIFRQLYITLYGDILI